MRRVNLTAGLGILISLALATPVLAAAPAQGVAVEGVSVPGAALGDTRAEIETGIGQPNWCQDVDLGGDQGACSFPIDGGEAVLLRFRSPDGTAASGGPTDTLYEAAWGDIDVAWTTSAGVSIASALADREAVAAAYPQADVIRDSSGVIQQVEDVELGVRVRWTVSPYTNAISARIFIFEPQPPVPSGERSMRVASLEMMAAKERGTKTITAVLRVLDERGLPVSGAQVFATWLFPSGATESTSSHYTSEGGYEVYAVINPRRGTYTLTVDDIVLDGFALDRDASVLSASITMGGKGKAK